MPAGRPEKPGQKNYHVRLPEKLIDRLDELADDEGKTRSDALAEGAAMYVKRAANRARLKPKGKA
jgi:metal-responsive CopG/Arc/MetJ family transcriptional regulator